MTSPRLVDEVSISARVISMLQLTVTLTSLTERQGLIPGTFEYAYTLLI